MQLYIILNYDIFNVYFKIEVGGKMKIVKRDGHIVDYCPEKIEMAIKKANDEVAEEDKVSEIQIKNIIKYIEG